MPPTSGPVRSPGESGKRPRAPPRFSPYPDGKTSEEQRLLRSGHHPESIAPAREPGLRAFYDDMHWGDGTAELTIVDPSIVTVISQRMQHEPRTEPRAEPHTAT